MSQMRDTYLLSLVSTKFKNITGEWPTNHTLLTDYLLMNFSVQEL